MENSDNSSQPVNTFKPQELFVQNLNGTSMEEVILLSLQIPLLVFVTILIEICVLSKLNIDLHKSEASSVFKTAMTFLLEVTTIVLPIVCMLTLFSNYLYLNLLFFLIFIQFIIICNVSSANDYILYWKLPYYNKKGLASEYFNSNKQAFVTYFRSIVLLVTSVSILAVDFNVFPRRFAKTEMYGVSIMDLGVGMFMISNGLVVKINHTSFIKSVKKVFLETAVLIVLGIARYFIIQRLDYQKHITEYGVHWNFFFTLGLVKMLSHFLLKIFRGHSFFVGLIIMAFHQYLLTFSLEEFVMNDLERDTWIKANREGLVSLLGYLSLYQFGTCIGQIVSSVKNKPIASKVKMLSFFIVLSFALYFITSFVNNTYFRVSRRLANLPFIVWTLTISLSTLTVCLVTELLLICFMPLKTYFRCDVYTLITPSILQGVNYNGLFFFLISNLFTGLVNLYVDVLNSDTMKSIFILFVYMIANCILVFILYLKNIQLKLW